MRKASMPFKERAQCQPDCGQCTDVSWLLKLGLSFQPLLTCTATVSLDLSVMFSLQITRKHDAYTEPEGRPEQASLSSLPQS